MTAATEISDTFATVPAALGRGIVVAVGIEVPAAFGSFDVVELNDAVLADRDALEGLILDLHLRWAKRESVVIRWGIETAEWSKVEARSADVWAVDADFLFPLERLRFLLFANNYDMRTPDHKWWFATKAERLVQATIKGPADVVLPDGTPAWVDGGPTGPIEPSEHGESFDATVISGEEVEAGRIVPIDGTYTTADDALADDQRTATLHPAGAARVIAPAGSGKTRTMAARLRHLLDDRGLAPEGVVAVAYNKRAAAELAERAGVSTSTVRTVHSLGWAILREAHPGIGLLDESGQRQILEPLLSINWQANKDPMAAYLEALNLARLGLEDPAAVEASGDDLDGFADCFDEYRRRIYEHGQVDFTEQIYGAIEALLQDGHLRHRWQRRCRHLLIDEFQDLTPAYVLLLRLLASPRLQVFGVGDDDQVIYAYSGADPHFLIEYDTWFPGATKYALETNYRCPEPVVQAATNLLSYNRIRVPKTIKPGPEASPDANALDVRLHPGGELAVEAADQISAWIDLGVAPHEIAVLARVNASLIPMKAALVDRDIATQDELSGNSLNRSMVRALFSWLRLGREPEKAKRADVLEAIRRPSRGLNGVAAKTTLPATMTLQRLREASDTMADRHATKWLSFCDDIAAVARATKTGDSRSAVGAVLNAAGLISSAQSLDRSSRQLNKPAHEDDLAALERAAALHRDLDTFESWLRSTMDRPQSERGVMLSSVHRVKGMEWPRVIVLGADAGALPHRLCDDHEEERRIFHVAITRCQEQVVILADEAAPSPFIAELATEAPPVQELGHRQAEQVFPRAKRPTGAKGGSTRSDSEVAVGDTVAIFGGLEGVVIYRSNNDVAVKIASGAQMVFPITEISRIILRAVSAEANHEQPLSDEDQEIFEALRSWRSDIASDRGLPPYVIFHDATMRAIARARPENEQELIAISGIGPAKLENYGDDILDVVAAAL